MFGNPDAFDGRAFRIDLSPGLLCEDTSALGSAFECGYQLAGKLSFSADAYSKFTAEIRHEKVNGYTMNLFSAGYVRRFGPRDALNLGIGLQRRGNVQGNHNRLELQLTVAP